MKGRKKIAVFFGGRSPEHDVSVITALQVMAALDEEDYDIIPVYLAINGLWWCGDTLRKKATYLPGPEQFAKLTQVKLDITNSGKPVLVEQNVSFLHRSSKFEFDVAFLAFHGLMGEDGQIQGMFQVAGVPYTGMRTMASAVLMDKVATKRILASTNIPMLPYIELQRPTEGFLITEAELIKHIGDFPAPWCVKPSHLGSSIGVTRADTVSEVTDVLLEVFKYDTTAILEPFIENMVEYNIAVSKAFGNISTSAIEQPKKTNELLDFKQKYLNSKNSKTIGKKVLELSKGDGMLSLTRELNPNLRDDQEAQIRHWAMVAFEAVAGSGAPRVDFIMNETTGEIWLNEVNPCPGSLSYFLWEASSEYLVLFSDLLNALIKEAIYEAARVKLPADPTPVNARLFSRRG
ncbi:MAG: D-alanine--D-alanine ligase [Hyphomicrobiaceae bacterium hypho_1]